MNNTRIEWADKTWNPVTGCRHTPTFRPDRLGEPMKVKKPSRIFVGSVSDLFGEWTWDVYENGDEEGFASGLVSREHVVNRILDIAKQCPQHTFIFLTKNPKGMQGFNFPDNCWCGTSVENQEKADERRPDLLKVNCKTLFVSYEPALGEIDFEKYFLPVCKLCNGDMSVPSEYGGGKPCPRCIDDQGKDPDFIKWLIIGAQTGQGAVKPKHEWITSAVRQATEAHVPVFLKDNLQIAGVIREYPGGD